MGKVQREELLSGRKENRMFVGEGGAGVLLRQRSAKRARLNGGDICAAGPQRSGYSFESLGTVRVNRAAVRRTSQGIRSA